MIANDKLGYFADRHTICFDLYYPHPPSAVWAAITDTDQLGTWLMPMTLELRVGGRVTLDPRQDRPSPAPPAEAVITALEPGALLEFRFGPGQDHIWPESTLRFELSPQGEGTRLLFSQRLVGDFVSPNRRISIGQIAGPGTFHPGTCAGWQGFFDEGLSRFLDGRRSPIYDEADDELMTARTPRYRRMLVDQFGDFSLQSNQARFIDRHTMVHTRWYPHPIERVWTAITDSDQASVWHGWPVRIDLRPGGHCVFGQPPLWESDIAALDPPHLIEFTHPDVDGGGAIRYELAQEDDGTRMIFTQWFLPGIAYRDGDTVGSDHPGGLNTPWRPDFVSGFHMMFDHLGWMLDGEVPESWNERQWEIGVPAYREHIRSTIPGR